MSEDELIAALARIFDDGAGPGVALGIGDDAAVLAAHDASTVVSVDAAVEGVHFRIGWATPAQLGGRALLAAVSDLAAMGASPRAALISLALPPSLRERVPALAEGIAAAARASGCVVIGGNVTRASELAIHTTVLGAIAAGRRPLTRAGARVGDGLFVTGTLGAAAIGLAAIEAGRADEPSLAPFAARWRAGRAQLALGAQLLGVASACLDVSDGLLRDAHRVATASDVRLVIDADALPLEPGHDDAARALDREPRSLALAGGEDYELLFTAPSGFDRPWARRIGEVRAADGARIEVHASGSPVAITHMGHDHFA